MCELVKLAPKHKKPKSVQVGAEHCDRVQMSKRIKHVSARVYCTNSGRNAESVKPRRTMRRRVWILRLRYSIFRLLRAAMLRA